MRQRSTCVRYITQRFRRGALFSPRARERILFFAIPSYSVTALYFSGSLPQQRGDLLWFDRVIAVTITTGYLS